MPSPNRREFLLMGAAFRWGWVLGPALLFLAMRAGVSRPAPWMAWIYPGVLLVLTGIPLGMYFARIAREMGAGGVGMAVLGILMTLILAARARSAIRGP